MKNFILKINLALGAKRKLFTLFFALVASAGTIFAESGTCGDNLTWNLTDGILTISGTGAMTDFSFFNHSPWYSYRSSIKSAILNDGVTSIGDYAFYECESLTSVTIPNSVTSIGNYAFEYCSGLTSVTIPNSVTSIGGYAFNKCSGLTSPVYNAHVFAYMPTSYSGAYTIPDGLESIAGGAFVKCTGLTSVTILNSVTSIGVDAFVGCTGLTSVTIGNSVTSIGNCAFLNCTGLTSVTIPNSVTSIGEAAFAGCSGLTSVTIPNRVTSIGQQAFLECSGLTSVTIPNSVRSIGLEAFADCTSLTYVTIPNSVTWIGSCAFNGCSNLTSVTIGNSVTSIGYSAFRGCTGLTSITCLAKTPPTIGQYAFSDIGKNRKLYVPKESINTYSSADKWKDFFPNAIFPITAGETTSTEVTATPTDDNSVVLSWPSVSGADTYTLEIRKKGELVCTLTFNAEGQLLTIHFAMPARGGNGRNIPAAEQTANGWQYTVNGLDPATEYTYIVTAKQGSSVLFTQSVEFHTNNLEPIDNILSDKVQSIKVLRSGQLFIERNGHTYDAKGQEVR